MAQVPHEQDGRALGQHPSHRGTAPARAARSDMALAVGAFCVSSASIVLLWKQNAVLLVLLSTEALVALRLWHERYDTIFFLVLATLGTVAEIVFVRCGVWQYANPTRLGIPVWFPLAFGTAGLACERLVAGIAMR